MKNLNGRIVMVTGGASGLGKAMVERFAEEGAKVVVADVNSEGARSVADSIGGKSVALNVADPSSVEAAVAFAVQTFGRLDVLVNNAGIESAIAPVHEATLENWERVIDVNLSGVFYGMKYGLAQMMKQGGGTIVNISSIAGLVGIRGLSAYAAAKGGVSNLTRSAALEYGPHGIRVNAIAPTTVMTPMIVRMGGENFDPVARIERSKNTNPLYGLCTPEDIAAAAAFLASDDARFITGVILPVDGGLTAQ